jgi:hypothetical protein
VKSKKNLQHTQRAKTTQGRLQSENRADPAIFFVCVNDSIRPLVGRIVKLLSSTRPPVVSRAQKEMRNKSKDARIKVYYWSNINTIYRQKCDRCRSTLPVVTTRHVGIAVLVGSTNILHMSRTYVHITEIPQECSHLAH